MIDEGVSTVADHPILEFVDREVPRDPRQRVLVLAPGAGAAAALRRRLTERRGALLGVDFVTPAGFGQRVLLLAGCPFATAVPDPLEERETLRRLLGEDGIGRYARRFPGALEHLRETLRELDALGPIAPRDALSRTGEEVIALARRFREAWAGRGGRSRWLAAAAVAAAGAPQELPDRVLVVGPRPQERDVLLLLQVLADQGVPVLDGAAAEYAPAAERTSCPHVVAELRCAARACSDAGAAGTPWHAMVVAAPRLAAYADHLDRAFRSEGVPYHTAAQTPLLRHPRAALCLHLARLLFDQAPRASFLALAASPLLAVPVPPAQIARLEHLSRRHALLGTGPETRQFLATLAQACAGDRDPGGSIPVHDLLGAVVHTARAAAVEDGSAPGWRRRSEILADWMAAHLVAPEAAVVPGDAAAAERLQNCLDAVVFAAATAADTDADADADTDAARDAGAAYTAELQDLLRTRMLPLGGSAVGGVHVVPFAEALAIPCERLHLLGLATDAVPGPPPLATFLGEADRAALGMATGERARDAEEQRLRLLLRHAPVLSLSYARADTKGRSRGFTLWADRIASTVELGAEDRAPAHPESVARRAVATGRCPTDVAIDHLALAGCTDVAPFAALLGDAADTARILARVAALESFHATALVLDGEIGTRRGADRLRAPLPVTGLQTLGACPQQFLFTRVLGIRPLLEEPDPLSLPRDRIGTLIHRVVETLYREFLPNLRAATDPMRLHDAMAARAATLLDDELARDTSILRRRFPGLHALLQQRWLAGLHLALAADLELMAADGSRPDAVERELQRPLPVRRPGDPDPVTLTLTGKLDRIDRIDPVDTGDHGDPGDPGDPVPAAGAARLRILDFKTGRKPEAAVHAAGIFKGTNLQLVLYAMLLHAATGDLPAQLEIRSIRPQGGGASAPGWRHELDHAPAFLTGDAAPGLEETLAILGRLIGRGLFPPRQDRHCAWCSFQAACRRFHPPSAQRVAQCESPELRDYLRLGTKSTQRRLLAPTEPGA